MDCISELPVSVMLKAYQVLKSDNKLNKIIDFDAFDKFIFVNKKTIDDGKAFSEDYEEVMVCENGIKHLASKIKDVEIDNIIQDYNHDTLYEALILIYRFYRILKTEEKRSKTIDDISEIDCLANMNQHFFIQEKPTRPFIPHIYNQLGTSYTESFNDRLRELYNTNRFDERDVTSCNYSSRVLGYLIKFEKEGKTNPLIKLSSFKNLNEVKDKTTVLEIDLNNKYVIEFDEELYPNIIPSSITVVDHKITPQSKIHESSLSNLYYCQLFAQFFYFYEDANLCDKICSTAYLLPSNLIIINGIPLIDFEKLSATKYTLHKASVK